MITCSSCNAQNPAGQKFCGQCGSPLIQGCSQCGAPKLEGQKFCGQCGTPYERVSATPLSAGQARPPLPNPNPGNPVPFNTSSSHPLAARVKTLTEIYQPLVDDVNSKKLDFVGLDSTPNNVWVQFFGFHPGGADIGPQNSIFMLGGKPSHERLFSETQKTFSASGNDSFFPALEVYEVEQTKDYIVVYFLIPRNDAVICFSKIIAFIEAHFGIDGSDWTVEAE